jgi:hypothetical protein
MAWLLQRLEWAADNLLDKDAEGVLVLNIDPEKDVLVSLEAVRAKPRLTREHLVVEEGVVTGIQYKDAPIEGSVWFEYDGVLHASCEELVTATGTLARDLAQTLGLPVETRPQRLVDADAAFLISDEFGFIPICDTLATSARSTTGNAGNTSATATVRMEECFAKMW